MKNNIKSLCILAYHTVRDSKNFEAHLSYLEENYSVISVEQLRQFICNKTKLPKNPLIITFDDGDLSVYENALPLLKKYRLPATLFVVTDLINSHKPFWWEEIEYYLGKEEGNKKVWEVKDWKNIELEKFLLELRKQSNKPAMRCQQLSTAQLKEMQASGFTIANHSHTHPMFNNCTREELEAELKNSKGQLEELGFTPDIFAYPNGNYSRLSETVLESHQIKVAFLFDHKINRGKINPLRISRLAVNDHTPLWKLKLILSGWHTKILPITRTLSKLRKK
ncbi:polysaccharide deacetylase family protein [Salegentibacter maritimus]|uniref:Polysaccharide deacetylase family protein n=1 Tax=Salegentibacter maritimus TaxID=2794347 RepID=A0ABS0TFH2_9FLAO|nr:polysaccharide deacetylase family protein [Salegentibacter maritimus]MBI6119768.1 polysaccharide deacetylase family protein [Salegentibacter maritimus]